jgi:hypothetical protein
MAARVTLSYPTTARPKSLADMTDEEFIRLVGPAPAWLATAWAHSRKHDLDKMTMDEIDAEIEAYRREKREAARSGNK